MGGGVGDDLLLGGDGQDTIIETRLDRNIVVFGRRAMPGRDKGRQRLGVEADDKTPTEKHAVMTWAKCLKRVFDNDVQTCDECGGAVKIVAGIEDPVAIKNSWIT